MHKLFFTILWLIYCKCIQYIWNSIKLINLLYSYENNNLTCVLIDLDIHVKW